MITFLFNVKTWFRSIMTIKSSIFVNYEIQNYNEHLFEELFG